MLLRAPINAPMVEDEDSICCESDVDAPSTEELVFVTLVLIVPRVLPKEDEELSTFVLTVFTLVVRALSCPP